MATVVTTSSCVQSFSLVIWEKAIFLSIPLCLVALFIGGNSLCVTAVATGYNTPEYCRFSQKQCIDNVCSTSLICRKFIILSIIECPFSIFVSISTLSFVCVQSTKNYTAFSAIQSVFFVVCWVLRNCCCFICWHYSACCCKCCVVISFISQCVSSIWNSMHLIANKATFLNNKWSSDKKKCCILKWIRIRYTKNR